MISLTELGQSGNEALFGENTGKQYVAMSLTAFIYHQIEHINNWTFSTFNNILTIGNNLYISIKQSISSYTIDHKTMLDHIYANMSHLHLDIKTGVLETYFSNSLIMHMDISQSECPIMVRCMYLDTQ